MTSFAAFNPSRYHYVKATKYLNSQPTEIIRPVFGSDWRIKQIRIGNSQMAAPMITTQGNGLSSGLGEPCFRIRLVSDSLLPVDVFCEDPDFRYPYVCQSQPLDVSGIVYYLVAYVYVWVIWRILRLASGAPHADLLAASMAAKNLFRSKSCVHNHLAWLISDYLVHLQYQCRPTKPMPSGKCLTTTASPASAWWKRIISGCTSRSETAALKH